LADLLQALSSGYVKAGQNIPQPGKYVDVEPATFEGAWRGKYANGKRFTITVSNVNGFRAKAKYEYEGEVKYQDVLIKNNAFRVGDSKFMLTRQGTAQVKTVMGNASGSSMETAYAKQNG
jgi:hypothetical protein